MVSAASTLRVYARPWRRDAELVAAVRAGDDRAFEAIYHRHQGRLYAYVLGRVRDHARAEDLVQELFISALRGLRAGDEEVRLEPWLYEIARNRCIDQHRRAARRTEVGLDDDVLAALDALHQAPPAEEHLQGQQRFADVRHALDGLSSVHLRLLVLRELEGRSYSEISARTGLSRPAVETGLFRARRRLRAEYDALASGDRCLRIESLIARAASARSLGPRDRLALARHVGHCEPCRLRARQAGINPRLLDGTPLGRAAAALAPLPGLIVRTMPALDPTAISGSGRALAGVAAAVALALGGGLLTPHHRHAARPAHAPAAVRHRATAVVRHAPPVLAARHPAAPIAARAAAPARGRQSRRVAVAPPRRRVLLRPQANRPVAPRPVPVSSAPRPSAASARPAPAASGAHPAAVAGVIALAGSLTAAMRQPPTTGASADLLESVGAAARAVTTALPQTAQAIAAHSTLSPPPAAPSTSAPAPGSGAAGAASRVVWALHG